MKLRVQGRNFGWSDGNISAVCIMSLKLASSFTSTLLSMLPLMLFVPNWMLHPHTYRNSNQNNMTTFSRSTAIAMSVQVGLYENQCISRLGDNQLKFHHLNTHPHNWCVTFLDQGHSSKRSQKPSSQLLCNIPQPRSFIWILSLCNIPRPRSAIRTLSETILTITV